MPQTVTNEFDLVSIAGVLFHFQNLVNLPTGAKRELQNSFLTNVLYYLQKGIHNPWVEVTA